MDKKLKDKIVKALFLGDEDAYYELSDPEMPREERKKVMQTVFSMRTPKEVIEIKQGKYAFIPGVMVKRALNIACGALNWDLRTTEKKLVEREVPRKNERGDSMVGPDGTVLTKVERSAITTVSLTIRMGNFTSIRESGGGNTSSNLSVDSIAKAADTDALKKAASAFGLFADLYERDSNAVIQSKKELRKKLYDSAPEEQIRSQPADLMKTVKPGIKPTVEEPYRLTNELIEESAIVNGAEFLVGDEVWTVKTGPRKDGTGTYIGLFPPWGLDKEKVYGIQNIVGFLRTTKAHSSFNREVLERNVREVQERLGKGEDVSQKITALLSLLEGNSTFADLYDTLLALQKASLLQE